MPGTLSISSPHLSLLLATSLLLRALTFCYLFIYLILKKGKKLAKAIAHTREAFAKHRILLFVAIKYSSAVVSIPSLTGWLLLDINLY